MDFLTLLAQAEPLRLDGTHLVALFVGVLVALLGGGPVAVGIGAMVARMFGKKPAVSATPLPVVGGSQASNIQMLAGRMEGQAGAKSPTLKRLAKLIDALTRRDTAEAVKQLQFVHEQSDDAGGFDNMVEKIVHERLPSLLKGKPDDRVEVYAVLSKAEGVDVLALVEAAKTNKTAIALPVASVLTPVFALVLCLVGGSMASAEQPERFVPHVRPAVMDEPVFRRTSSPRPVLNPTEKIYAELGKPQGAHGACCDRGCQCGPDCQCGPACACGQHGSSWGSGRRFGWRVAAAGRFVLRPFRRWRR